jgi:hypothetical protein
MESEQVLTSAHYNPSYRVQENAGLSVARGQLHARAGYIYACAILTDMENNFFTLYQAALLIRFLCPYISVIVLCN